MAVFWLCQCEEVPDEGWATRPARCDDRPRKRVASKWLLRPSGSLAVVDELLGECHTLRCVCWDLRKNSRVLTVRARSTGQILRIAREGSESGRTCCEARRCRISRSRCKRSPSGTLAVQCCSLRTRLGHTAAAGQSAAPVAMAASERILVACLLQVACQQQARAEVQRHTACTSACRLSSTAACCCIRSSP